MRIMAIVAGLGTLALTGCEEFAFQEIDPDVTAFTALQDETLALRDEVEFLTVATASEIPITGSATYDGTALIALDSIVDGSELIGDAVITADFANDTVSGGMSDFYGTINGGDVTAFAGELFIGKSEIDTSGGDQITAKLDGALQGGSNTLNVNATLNGNFLTDNIITNEPPEAMSLESSAASILTLNGVETAGGIEVIAVD